ncbi:OprO/OprP family phosphate-selective porin [Urechidicola croceus]|uniref:Porin n=1 Tax=Urechidicola croceus TaxID=1850246 RepID=A0A1D8P8V1_9FLAO|nr:porin [Urechidicola croceus]AOW21013.1 hypothetical protein LPB138_10130 [Urechidicola croceus]
MMNFKTVLRLLLYSFVLSINAQEKKDNLLVSKSNNGLKFENSNKSIQLNTGGRIINDIGVFSLNNEAEINGYDLYSKNGNEFRRIQLYTSGELFQNYNYKIDVNFAEGKVTLMDTYLTLKNIPSLGNIRVDYFFESFRLDAITSHKYTTFTEKSLPTSIIPVRNTDVMIFNSTKNKRFSWQVTYFNGANKLTSDKQKSNGEYTATSRIAGSVIKTTNNLLHLGFSHSYRKQQSDQIFQFKVPPETHTANSYLNSNIENVTNVNLFNIETVLFHNSITLQTEYTYSTIKSSIENNHFNSYYSQLSYFISGEKKTFRNSIQNFGRIKPNKNLGTNGFGALELKELTMKI